MAQRANSFALCGNQPVLGDGAAVLARSSRGTHGHVIEQASRRWRGGRTQAVKLRFPHRSRPTSPRKTRWRRIEGRSTRAPSSNRGLLQGHCRGRGEGDACPGILEDDEDQQKQLVRDVATCLKCAERPFVSGSLPDACTYDPGTLAVAMHAVAARLVVEQALPQEQDAV